MDVQQRQLNGGIASPTNGLSAEEILNNLAMPSGANVETPASALARALENGPSEENSQSDSLTSDSLTEEQLGAIITAAQKAIDTKAREISEPTRGTAVPTMELVQQALDGLNPGDLGGVPAPDRDQNPHQH